MKAAVLRALGRLGLLLPAYRGYERLRAFGAQRIAVGPDGLPVPPPELIVRVAGTADADWFLEGGRLAEESIRAALARAGTSVEAAGAIHDFGCGCGRVVRRWQSLAGPVHGTDLNADAIAWCREHLPFARFEVNALEPPLPLTDGSLGLVFALSVLTHLAVETQLRWLDELRRVLRPGGWLLVTVHGEAYLPRLNAAEAARFDGGECVVRWSEVAGSNLCTTFHPESFVRETLAQGWELVELVPRGALGNPEQDLVLLRKPAV